MIDGGNNYLNNCTSSPSPLLTNSCNVHLTSVDDILTPVSGLDDLRHSQLSQTDQSPLLSIPRTSTKSITSRASSTYSTDKIPEVYEYVMVLKIGDKLKEDFLAGKV